MILSLIFIEVLFLLVLFQKDKKFLKSLNRSQVFLFGAIAILSVYHILTMYTPIIFFGNQFRMQGVLLLWHLLLFSLIASSVRLPKVAWYWFVVFLLAMLVLSLLFSNQNGRAVATLGEPNALSAFIIFLWPFLFFANIPQNIRVYVQMLSIISTMGIIFLSFSRSGLAGFLMQGVFMLLVYKMKLPLKKVIVACFVCISMLYLLPLIEKTPYENRIGVWKTALIAGFKHPILGGGLGNTEVLIRNASLKLHNNLIGYYVDSSHNIFLDWWVQAGVIGLSVLILLLFFAVRSLYIHKNKRELVVLLGLLTVISFNPASVVTLVGFWWLIGRGFAKEG